MHVSCSREEHVTPDTHTPPFVANDLQNWKTLQQAEVAIPAMKGICTSVAESWLQWQEWRADASAHRAPLPSGWEEKLNRFQKIIIIRALAEVKQSHRKKDLAH